MWLRLVVLGEDMSERYVIHFHNMLSDVIVYAPPTSPLVVILALASRLWIKGGVPAHEGHACLEEPHESHHQLVSD